MSKKSKSRMSPLVMGLVAKIRQTRARRGFSQAEVARRAGMLPTNYCRLEQGKQDFYMRTFLRVIDALGLEIELRRRRGK